jgi:hypothetical protein
MNSDVDELALAVLKKPLQECSLEELQELTEKYPYFGPAQFLLAKKFSEPSLYSDNDPAHYEEQVQKASLYFQNRVWLHHLLNNDESSAPFVSYPPINLIGTSTEQKGQTMGDHFDAQPAAERTAINQSNEEDVNDPAEIAAEPISATSESIEQGLIQDAKEELANPISGNPDLPQQTDLSPKMPQSSTQPVTANAGLVFEPYHTVDYFASQGIRFKDDEKPKDRLGMQLKSFTEWLKTLKQVPVADLVKHVDSSAEKKVEQMAEYSIAERHVITEAMAEVWKKQGNRAKAEEIYRKLSLLDPSKSSYFAAKIEELKKTN